VEPGVHGGEDGEGIYGGAPALDPTAVGSTVLLLPVAVPLGPGVVGCADIVGAHRGPPALVPIEEALVP